MIEQYIKRELKRFVQNFSLKKMKQDFTKLLVNSINNFDLTDLKVQIVDFFYDNVKPQFNVQEISKFIIDVFGESVLSINLEQMYDELVQLIRQQMKDRFKIEEFKGGLIDILYYQFQQVQVQEIYYNLMERGIHVEKYMIFNEIVGIVNQILMFFDYNASRNYDWTVVN